MKTTQKILTEEQIKNALIWYNKHKTHVASLIKNIEKDNVINNSEKFPPTLAEDKRDCTIWKPEHWNWFLEHFNNA